MLDVGYTCWSREESEVILLLLVVDMFKVAEREAVLLKRRLMLIINILNTEIYGSIRRPSSQK